MNFVFTTLFFCSVLLLLIRNPDGVVGVLLSGAEKSATLCVAILSSYVVFSALMGIWEDTGVCDGVARVLSPIVRRVFKAKRPDTVRAVAMTVSANLLGLGGVATPFGIQAMSLLERDGNAYGKELFFALNASALGLFSTSVVAIRSNLGSVNPSWVVFPIMLCVCLSSLCVYAVSLPFRGKLK